MFTEINLDNNISHIPPGLLTGAVIQLKLVALNWFKRNVNQCTSIQFKSILEMLAQKKSMEFNIRKLLVGWLDMHNITSELLTSAVRNLDRVYFRNTIFTVPQLEGITSIGLEGKQCMLNKIIIRHPRIVGNLSLQFYIDLFKQNLVKFV